MLNYAPSLDRVFQALADPGRRLMVERRLDRLGEYLTQTAHKPDQGWATDPGETTSEHEEQP
jgi:hypothetical protein